MKKDVPKWVWVVIGILVILVIFLNVSYYNCVLEKVDYTKEYLALNIDYIELLICYQEGLPTCEPQIEKYGNASVFTQNP